MMYILLGAVLVTIAGLAVVLYRHQRGQPQPCYGDLAIYDADGRFTTRLDLGSLRDRDQKIFQRGAGPDLIPGRVGVQEFRVQRQGTDRLWFQAIARPDVRDDLRSAVVLLRGDRCPLRLPWYVRFEEHSESNTGDDPDMSPFRGAGDRADASAALARVDTAPVKQRP